MNDTEKFNPRGAALRHAARATLAEIPHSGPAGTTVTDVSDLANTIACGLVYVGDQLRRSNRLAEYELLRERIRDSTGRDPAQATELGERLRELAEELWGER